MNKNRLGQSDLYVSEVGFGSMSLPDDEQSSIRLIHHALDSGVNFIDTADLYGRGRVEDLVGKALTGKRQDVILATKVGNRWEADKPGWHWDATRAYIKEAVKNSLRRLGTDYIDLYQLHGGMIEDDFDDTVRAFEELQQEGYIRWYGISSIRPNVIRRFAEHANIVSVMMQYSILDRRPEECCLDFLLQKQISVIARGPLAKGALSTSMEQRLEETGYLDYSKPEILYLGQHLRTLTSSECGLTQLALRYPLSHPAVATVVPGASRLEQLRENLAVASCHPLSDDQLAQIQAWSKTSVYQQHR